MQPTFTEYRRIYKMRAVLKICEGTYSNYDCIENVITYISDRNNVLLYGQGCSDVPEIAINNFYDVNAFYNSKGIRKLRHFIVSFKVYREIDDVVINQFANYAASYYSTEYQIFYGIMNDNGHIHIHFCQNMTNFRNGSKFPRSLEEKRQFLTYLNNFPNIEVISNNFY